MLYFLVPVNNLRFSHATGTGCLAQFVNYLAVYEAFHNAALTQRILHGHLLWQCHTLGQLWVRLIDTPLLQVLQLLLCHVMRAEVLKHQHCLEFVLSLLCLFNLLWPLHFRQIQDPSLVSFVQLISILLLAMVAYDLLIRCWWLNFILILDVAIRANKKVCD